MHEMGMLSGSFALLLIVFSCATDLCHGDKIQVHLVPHTHVDTGWLKTVDQYYYGAHNDIQHAAIQYILYTVVEELQNNPNRTFIWVEMAYFARWWKEQDETTRNIVRKLVAETHQLEFINAGWCMNDEAATDYNAIIDQMSIGLRFVEENFGPTARPRVGWHIDPFGHSTEMATIHAMLGMDGIFFWRIHYADHEKRLKEKTMEIVWRGSKSLGEQTEIFTGILYEGYGPPSGFCFDLQCSSVIPIQDDPDLEGYNVDERVTEFVNAVTAQNDHYTTGHVMLTMGSDFQYESALENYHNLDKLISYVNAKSDTVEVFYSTPSRYLDAVNKLNKTWTVKTDDFFPYADRRYSCWTGYYTSRPGLKGYIRVMNGLLQSCKQIEVLGEKMDLHDNSTFTSTKLKLAVALNQHHDAVTGTEKQAVADDYAKRLYIGQVQCHGLMNDYLRRYLSSYKNVSAPSFQFCDYLNISVCPASEANHFAVMLHNPLGRATTRMVHFPVNGVQFEVFDSKAKPVVSQVIPVSSSTRSVRRSRGNATHDLYWQAKLPALGGSMFFVRQTAACDSRVSELSEKSVPPSDGDFTIENEALVLTFSGLSGRLKSMYNKLSKISAGVDQSLLWWEGSDRYAYSQTPSGAYIFSPVGDSPHEVSPQSTVSTSTINGTLIQEVRQQWSPWAYQTVRLYKDLPIAMFEYTIGPIPDQDQIGKEIVSRFTTNLDTKATWYTDANGREMQKRIRNYRPTWQRADTEPVAGNYYPITSRIYMRDEDRGIQFTVMTDRAQGGSSLNDGQLELMIHRRLFKDDDKGVREALNEPGQFGDGLITRGCHYVILDNFTSSTLHHRTLGEQLLLGTQSYITRYTGNTSDWITKFPTTYSGLARDLPSNIHLLTLERLDHTHHLLRLEHQAQIDEAPLNNTATIQLETLFSSMKVVDAVELSLGGNALLSDIHRLHWKTKTTDTTAECLDADVDKRWKAAVEPPFIVELKPMEIRTFNITVKYV